MTRDELLRACAKGMRTDNRHDPELKALFLLEHEGVVRKARQIYGFYLWTLTEKGRAELAALGAP